MNIESVAVGYMIGSSIGSSKGTNEDALSCKSFPIFTLIAWHILNVIILCFFGDIIFDLSGLSIFLKDVDTENLRGLQLITEVSNKVTKEVLTYVTISSATLFPSFLYKLYKSKEDI